MRIIIFLLFVFLTGINFAGDKIKMKIHKNEDGTYSVLKHKLEMIIDPNFGGRITSFKLNGYEFLVQEKEISASYGSTFWPSPQSVWNWPPLKTLDSDPYKIIESDSLLEMKSGIDDLTGCSFTKSLSESNSDNSLKLVFNIENESEKDFQVSPWQITRVKKGGLLFFPMGEGVQKKKSFPLAKTSEIDGVVWYSTKSGETFDSHLLNTADGSEGWIAYAIDNKLFIKKFQDNKPEKFAPGESEVLFYTSGNLNYIEIEAQGPYEKLTCGGSSVWNMEWFASEIPINITILPGSKELINLVRKLIE